MKKNLFLFVAALLATSTAFADKVVCYFNEPTLTATYDSDTNTFIVSALGKPPESYTAQVLFNKGGAVQVSDKNSTHYLEFNSTKNGSDGMSDYIYPFHASVHGTYNNPAGGCETNFLKKYK